MKSKKSPLNIRKLPYNLALVLLTAGASLILGFLSFGGMYALIPMLPVAFAAFGLSVAYESEIYLQNIKAALNKLFKRDYLEQHLAKEYLLKHVPLDDAGNIAEDAPQFFHDYKKQLQLLADFGHKSLDHDSKQAKKAIKRTLADMEKRFAVYLFVQMNDTPTDNQTNDTTADKKANGTTAYNKELCDWLTKHQQKDWQETLASRKAKFNLVKGFSLLSASFMTLGSTYLMVEAFSIIPFFATISFTLWPLVILPMAIVAGAAYGMLTFNAVTDLINNNTVAKWYNKIKHDLSQGITVRTVFMTAMATLLVGLAVALTVCTAGTWWTIATNARPLFDWMHRMPSFIMGGMNPFITGSSAIAFSISNISASLEMVDEAADSENVFKRMYRDISKGMSHVARTENWLQIVNPFRLMLILTLTPLRVLLFLGHLVSISVTTDKMPGISQLTSAIIAFISEGFEDAHYFIGHSHDHDKVEDTIKDKQLLNERLGDAEGHSHDNDIPTWALKTVAMPLYALAATWDMLTSKLNASPAKNELVPKELDWAHAWNKQRGISAQEHVAPSSQRNDHPSFNWQQEHALAQIHKFERKHLSATKSESLQQLKKDIVATTESAQLKELLTSKKTTQSAHNSHGFFASTGEQEQLEEFINDLPHRVNVRVA